MESIYSFIKSYIPNAKRDPKEDYLTQILAWTLVNISGFRQQFIGFLVGRLESPLFTELSEESTQVQTQYSNENGFIDMLIWADGNGFIFEHKIDSSLSINQIEKYRQAISSMHEGIFYTVLITATRMQHTQQADIKLVWADVYDFILEVIDDYDNHERFLLEQLTAYLKQQGLGRMDPVNMDNILGYFPGMELESKLDVLFERVMEVDWTAKCSYLNSIQNDTYSPVYNKRRWGRKGIDFFSSWKPGIFAGFIMDVKDHGLLPAEVTNGPDFVIFLEHVYDKKRPELMEKRSRFMGSPNFNELNRRLVQNSGSFEYLPGLEKSPWRLVVLRKPAKEIFNGTSTLEEQVKALRDAICEGLDLITQDNLVL